MRMIIVALLVAGEAFAQPQCPPGKSASEATLWHCCWPQQSWSDQMDRCVGPPLCPPGLVADENDCKPPPPVATVYQVPARENAAPQKNRRMIQAGAALFGISYGAAIALGAYGAAMAATTPFVYDVPSFNDHLAAQLTWNFIPLVGPAIACAQYATVKEFQFTTANGELWTTRNESAALVCAGEIAGMAIQITGLALLGAGARRSKPARAWNFRPLVGPTMGVAGAF